MVVLCSNTVLFECARTSVFSWVHMERVDVQYYKLRNSSVDLQVKHYNCTICSSRSIGFRMMLACSAVRTLVHGSSCQHEFVNMQVHFHVAF